MKTTFLGLSLLVVSCGSTPPPSSTEPPAPVPAPTSTGVASAARASTDPCQAAIVADISNGPSCKTVRAPKADLLVGFRAELLAPGLFPAAPLTFAPSTAKLSPGCDPTLKAIAELLRRYPFDVVQVAVHLDKNDTPSSDQAQDVALTRQRAKAIVKRLKALGVSASKLQAVGYGSACRQHIRTDQKSWATAVRFIGLRYGGKDVDVGDRTACPEAFDAGLERPRVSPKAPRSDIAAVHCDPPPAAQSIALKLDRTTVFDSALPGYETSSVRGKLPRESQIRIRRKRIKKTERLLCTLRIFPGDRYPNTSKLFKLGTLLEQLAFYVPEERLALRTRALTVLNEALRQSDPPDQRQVRFHLATIYRQSRRYEQALAEFDRLIKDECSSAKERRYAQVGVALTKLSMARDEAERLKPNARPRLTKAKKKAAGDALKKLLGEAEAAVREAVALGEKYDAALAAAKCNVFAGVKAAALPNVVLGHILGDQGRRDEAKKVFAKVVASDYGTIGSGTAASLIPDWAR